MGITYSNDQLRVIQSRDKNLLVSAAAGAGKTSVLVERILRRATDPVHPIDMDKILVVTFTKAAAAEMKERIRIALENELAANPQNLNLQKQATLIHNAQISTIDGFCLNLVRNNFHRIGLDPSFRIANEGEIKLLKKDILKQVMDEAYESANQAFFDLVDRYTLKDKDTAIEESIEGIYNMSMSCPFPEKWLEDCRKDYAYKNFEEFRNSEFMKNVSVYVLDSLREALSYLEEAMVAINEPEGPDCYSPMIESDTEQLKEVIVFAEQNDLVGIQKTLESFEFVRISNSKKGDPELREKVKNLRELTKEIVNGLKKDYFNKSLEDIYEDICESGKSVNTLIDLVLKFMHTFDEQKRERDIIDFSDMGHMAINILIDDFQDMDHYTVSDAALEYRDYFEEIMTDEYQDSNQVQEIILASISRAGSNRPGNRFMVGDIKQSIYRFRLARPEIFKGKEIEYEASKKESEVVRLKENHRSRKDVVDSVNDVFETVMHEEIGGVEYNVNERLNAAAVYPECDETYTTKIILQESGEMNSEESREYQAQALAEMILETVGTKQVYDGKNKVMRTANFGDIAILFRGLKKWRTPIKKAFDAAGIPYHMEGTGTFYEAREIKDVLNLLRVIDNPLNDIPLFGTMTSLFGGMDDSLAAQIKAESESTEYYLWDKLRGFSIRHPENEKVSSFITMINDYRYKVTYTPIGDLITEIVTETGYTNYVLALTDGKQREANLELLIKKAQDYAKTSFSGLFHFLRYVELIRKNEEDEGEANIFDENSDTVRVMTIHKSKGLEFPVCIVGGIDDSFNGSDSSGAFLSDIDEGIATHSIDPKLRTKCKTLKYKYMADKIYRDNVGEEIRILYVAMTRAKEQLILFGAAKEAEQFFENGKPAKLDSYLGMLKKTLETKGNDNFILEIVNPEDIQVSSVKREIDRQYLRNDIENGDISENVETLADSIEKNITSEYKHKNLEKLYTKTTVSELKMAAMEEVQGETKELFEKRERSVYVPSFAGGGVEISGTDRGTAYHKLLQLIDYTKDISESEWSSQFEKMVSLGNMTKEEQELVPLKKIHTFGKTNLAERMHKAALRGELYKEQPFVMGVPANRLNPDFPSEELVLVQGVIDVFFIEDDNVIVMDYKTDRVENSEELSARYKEQINIYAEALEKLTGKPVTGKILYSFGLNETVVLE